jgi:tetratricopeptide (TPR) repeat protein
VIRSTLLLIAALTLAMPGRAQEDADGVAAPVRELLQCRAGWHRNDTLHFTVRGAQHSVQNGATTSTNDHSYQVDVVVLDSTANGYRLHWQRRNHELDFNRSMLPAALHSVMDSIEALQVLLVTDVNGTLLGVENYAEVTRRWNEQVHRVLELMVQEAPPEQQAGLRERLTRWEQQSGLLEEQLLESIRFFFMPYGMFVYNDTLYTAPYNVPNPMTGSNMPGRSVSELVHVDELTYRIDVQVLIDEERFREEVRKIVNRMNKLNRTGERVGRKEMPALGFTSAHSFVLDVRKSWPQHFTARYTSEVEGLRTERSIHITRSTASAAEDAPLTELELDAQIAADPHDPRPYRNRGWLREQRDDHAGAIEDYTMALTMDSAHARTWMLRGFTYQQYNQHAQALQDLERAVALDPADADIHQRRARILMDLNRDAEAEAALLTSLSIDSVHSGALRAYNRLLVRAYRFDEALRIADRYVNAYPERAHGYGDRAAVRFDLRTPEQDSLAMLDLRKALAMDPTEPSTLTSLGNRHLGLEQYDSAMYYFDRLITLDPNDAVALHNRGFARMHLGQHEDAIADMRESLDMDSAITYAHNNIGWALHLAGRSAEGLASIDRAIAQMPTNAYAYYNRGRVLVALGRTAEACAAWDHAEAIGFSKAYGDAVRKERAQHCGR